MLNNYLSIIFQGVVSVVPLHHFIHLCPHVSVFTKAGSKTASAGGPALGYSNCHCRAQATRRTCIHMSQAQWRHLELQEVSTKLPTTPCIWWLDCASMHLPVATHSSRNLSELTVTQVHLESRSIGQNINVWVDNSQNIMQHRII